MRLAQYGEETNWRPTDHLQTINNVKKQEHNRHLWKPNY